MENQIVKNNSVKIIKITCVRCGHRWWPRIHGDTFSVPVMCPQCKGPWNKPKIRNRQPSFTKEEE